MPFIKPRLRGAIVSIASLVAALALTAAPAGADVISAYPPESEARNFAAGQGDWTESSSFASCPVLLPILLPCPTVTNTFEGTGGAGGEGHIRSSFEATLLAIGTAIATWQSPGFTYSGAGGEAPASLSFGVSRRADVADLLSGITGSSATYSVALIDQSDGDAVIPVVGPLSLDGVVEWAAAPAVPVDPSLLTLGDEYAVRISSTYVPGTLVGAFVSGSADYDNVALTATRPDDPDPPDDGGGGAGGDGGGGGAGGDGGAGGGSGNASTSSTISSTRDLQTSLRRGTPATAKLNGRRVMVRLACPRRAEKACRITAQGRMGKGTPVTNRRSVKVAKGKSRLVALNVKPRFRSAVAKRKRLLVVQKVRAGKVTATFSRSRALIRP